MPELPEVETVCRNLKPHLVGRRVMSFELLWPRTVSTSGGGTFEASIVGKPIEDVRRRAKLITLRLSGGEAITVHLRMTGELLWLPSGGSPPFDRSSYLRAAFLLDDSSELLFYDVRKFGRISFLSSDEVHHMNTHFGIEPFEPEFTPSWLTRNLSLRKRRLKPLLLDQTFIAGLGNIYVDEALFASRLHPQTRSDMVSRRKAAVLHDAIVSILSGAVERQGTTFRDYRSGLGSSGENQSTLMVYGSRSGSPCPRCGTGLQRLVVGQRGTIICPTCQKLKRPTDMPRQ